MAWCCTTALPGKHLIMPCQVERPFNGMLNLVFIVNVTNQLVSAASASPRGLITIVTTLQINGPLGHL